MADREKLPLFMAPVVRYEPPAYRPSDLLPGVAVTVVQAGEAYAARVISKARIWINVEEVLSPDCGRTRPRRGGFRLDDQTDGSQGPYSAKFLTHPQREYQQTLLSAQRFLAGQGVRATGLWSSHEVELARLVWRRRKSSQPTGLKE
jgi:hypothetical protein